MTNSVNMLLLFAREVLIPPADTHFIITEDEHYIVLEDGTTKIVTEG